MCRRSHQPPADPHRRFARTVVDPRRAALRVPRVDDVPRILRSPRRPGRWLDPAFSARSDVVATLISTVVLIISAPRRDNGVVSRQGEPPAAKVAHAAQYSARQAREPDGAGQRRELGHGQRAPERDTILRHSTPRSIIYPRPRTQAKSHLAVIFCRGCWEKSFPTTPGFPPISPKIYQRGASSDVYVEVEIPGMGSLLQSQVADPGPVPYHAVSSRRTCLLRPTFTILFWRGGPRT